MTQDLAMQKCLCCQADDKEVAAAARAAFEMGAEDVLVKDAHGTARNLLLEELPERLRVHRGWDNTPYSDGGNRGADSMLFSSSAITVKGERTPILHIVSIRQNWKGSSSTERELVSLYSITIWLQDTVSRRCF